MCYSEKQTLFLTLSTTASMIPIIRYPFNVCKQLNGAQINSSIARTSHKFKLHAIITIFYFWSLHI